MKKLTEANLIENRIYLIRGQKVMLSPHLAELYNVQTKVLVQAVKRNVERFPGDFMFQLSWRETKNSRSQFGGESIKSVDDSFHCRLVFVVIGSVLLPIAGAIEDWKPSDCVGIGL